MKIKEKVLKYIWREYKFAIGMVVGMSLMAFIIIASLFITLVLTGGCS